MGSHASAEQHRTLRVLTDPLDLMRLALLVGGIAALVAGPREQGVRLVLTFGIVLVPRALHVPRPFDLAFLLGMYFQAWGNLFGAFDHVYGYDKVVHFVLPTSLSALLYLMLVRYGLAPGFADQRGLHQRAGTLIVTAAFGLAFGGGLYELYEWFANTVLGANLYTTYGDTIGDLVDDTLGALVGGLLVSVWVARNWTTTRPGAPEPREGRTLTSPRIRRLRTLLRKRGRPPLSLPPMLITEWTWLVRDVADVARLALVGGALLAAATGDWEHSARFALSFLLSVGVRLIDPPRLFDLAFMAAMSFQAWGHALGGSATPGYRTIAHAAVSLTLAPMIYLLAVRLRVLPELEDETRLHQRAAIAVTGFAMGFCAGIFFELYLYAVDHVFGTDLGPPYGALVGRLAVDAAGALGGAALLVAWDSFGWGTRRRLPVGAAEAGPGAAEVRRAEAREASV